MASMQPQIEVSLPAGEDLSDHQFKFVSISAGAGGQTAGRCYRTAADGRVDGVSMTAPSTAGHALNVLTAGIAKVEAGGTIAAGALVKAAAGGEAITAATGNPVYGIALNSAVDGELVEVLLKLGPATAA